FPDAAPRRCERRSRSRRRARPRPRAARGSMPERTPRRVACGVRTARDRRTPVSPMSCLAPRSLSPELCDLRHDSTGLARRKHLKFNVFVAEAETDVAAYREARADVAAP